MRKLTFGMNLSLDGYIAASGADLGWSVPSDELFQWWSDRVGATGLALYGRKLWETMSSHWPTADQQPGATPAEIEFARRWRDMPKVVFASTTSTVDWNTRLVTGDAVTEITRLKADDGGPMDIGGATLAAAAMRSGLIDEYAIVTHPVPVGGGAPFSEAIVASLPDPVLHRRRSVRIGIRLRHSAPRSLMNAGVLRRRRRGARLATTHGSATWPDALRPVHRHNEGALELPIGWRSSTIAVAFEGATSAATHPGSETSPSG